MPDQSSPLAADNQGTNLRPARHRNASAFWFNFSTFWFIVIWVVVGLAVATLLTRLWTGRWLWTPFVAPEQGWGPDPWRQVIQLVLTVIGGIGGIGYLVIKYRDHQQARLKAIRDERGLLVQEGQLRHLQEVERNRKDEAAHASANLQREEQRRALREAVERAATSYDKNVQMLGSPSPSTRIAAVFALVSQADGGEVPDQNVVSLLCGYLRAARSQDTAVEQEILEAVRTHTLILPAHEDVVPGPSLERPVSSRWSDCTFDLRGANFHAPLTWERCRFSSMLDLSEAIFERRASFAGAELADAKFVETVFRSEANFSHLENAGGWYSAPAVLPQADFTGTRFEGSATFGRVKFGDAKFSHAHFMGQAEFGGAPMDNAWFWKATFLELANFSRIEAMRGQFDEVTCPGWLLLPGAVFTQGFSLDRSWRSERRVLQIGRSAF